MNVTTSLLRPMVRRAAKAVVAAAAVLPVASSAAVAAVQADRLPLNHRPNYPLNCRGGERLLFDTLAAPSDTATTVRLALTFIASPTAAGPEGRGLPPAGCAWVDRPVSDGEPRQVRVTVHATDSTPRATVRDTGLYWSFLAHNSDSGHFTAVGYRHWHDSSPPAPHAAPAPVAATAAGRSSRLPFDPRYLALFAAGWTLIAWVPATVLIGRWSGWHRLAGLYPDRNHGRGRSFRSGRLVMGKTNYRGGARLTADDTYLHFSMGPFVRPGHPPFSVPWSDLTASRDTWPWFPFRGHQVTRLTLARQPGLRIILPAPVGERIAAARGGTPAARPGDATLSALLLPLALGLVAWSGGGAGAVAEPCPTTADMETTIGFPVRAHAQVADHCMYELTGEYQGAFVTLSYQPASRASDRFEEIKRRTRGILGANAQPDRVTVGEGGLGYSSRGRREAAAVAQGRLYHVDMEYDLHEGLKLREDAAVRVIELAMRTTPARKSAASFDACQLASNAEVSEIAEERPELAKFWSAPEASAGGTHCQYDGGTIRVYHGKAAGAALESLLKNYKADKQPRVPVKGVGERAFFMIPLPNDKYNRFGLLAVYAGPRVVQLTLDAQGEEPVDATKPRLERLARLVLPRLPS